VRAQLLAAVEGADPTEIASLCDALEDPGDLDYSPEARGRFALLAAELRRLRGAIGEPILDLVRRIIDTIGIDVELASSVSPAAAARRENLDLFVQAVAEFQAVDGQVTLAALLAWLEAEDDFGQGLDVATPSEADSVKLLTVHRAKGLEWDAVILPMLEDGSLPIRQAIEDPDALAEERRLFYVGITRARRMLHLSWADRRETRGRDGRRQRSRFLDGLLPAAPRRVIQHPDRFAPPPRRPSVDDDPLMSALRTWRTGRAREDAVPAYVVAHDQTLAAIADLRPTSLAALRRVRGMGPTKLDRYGEEILAVIAADASTGEA
jgi:superfamily I DNA/RNA helicase